MKNSRLTIILSIPALACLACGRGLENLAAELPVPQAQLQAPPPSCTPTTVIGFSGNYAIGTWTEDHNTHDGSHWNIAGAPGNVILTTDPFWANSADGMYNTAKASGTVTFNFSYNLNGGLPSNFPAYYDAAGVYTKISNDAGALAQTGTNVSFAVNKGDSFGFAAGLTVQGVNTLSLTISNFSAPDCL